MKKVATYVRVSNHSNAENAVRNQSMRVKDFCEAKGYSVEESAAVVGDRKMAYVQLKRLLNSAKEKGIDTIVMASVNRIAGSVDEMAEISKAFTEAGVSIEAIDGSHEGTLNQSMLIESFLAKVAEQEDAIMNGDQDEDGQEMAAHSLQ